MINLPPVISVFIHLFMQYSIISATFLQALNSYIFLPLIHKKPIQKAVTITTFCIDLFTYYSAKVPVLSVCVAAVVASVVVFAASVVVVAVSLLIS